MKSKLYLFLYLMFAGINMLAQTTTNIFDNVVYYDGYAALTTNQPPPDGAIRLSNDLITKKLTAAQLAGFGNTLTMNVYVKALCDNYDRLGYVNLALVPKTQNTYIPASVQRIELARFITPFMNYNFQPDTVPFTFEVNNVAKIFKDPTINALYNIWIELQIFGVPYAANTQVAGCAGRNDVFYGSLEFESNGIQPASNEVVIPLNFQKNLNNYQAAATDAVGTTERTIVFNVATSLINTSFHLITSNHGANSGGEEYNRRFHFIDYDGSPVLNYKPGELTCEPYRIYNTQANGIYGASPRTPAQWQSFSNWCPGSVIPIRRIVLGNVSAGNHTFKIRVPMAVFANGEGNIPVSLYLQGTNTVLGLSEVDKISYSIFPNPTTDIVNIDSENKIEYISVTDITGKELIKTNSKSINISKFENGIYFLNIKFEKFNIRSEKIIKH